MSAFNTFLLPDKLGQDFNFWDCLKAVLCLWWCTPGQSTGTIFSYCGYGPHDVISWCPDMPRNTNTFLFTSNAPLGRANHSFNWGQDIACPQHANAYDNIKWNTFFIYMPFDYLPPPQFCLSLLNLSYPPPQLRPCFPHPFFAGKRQTCTENKEG